MSNRQIHKFSFPVSALEVLPKEQLSTFLLLGLFLNEANWLQKLLLVSTLDRSGNEAEEKARLALSLMLSKGLAAKIHQGWCRMQGNPMRATLIALPLSTQADQLHQELAPMLAKGSIIHSVRNCHAFHYPTRLSLDGLPGIAQADVAIYATPLSTRAIRFRWFPSYLLQLR